MVEKQEKKITLTELNKRIKSFLNLVEENSGRDLWHYCLEVHIIRELCKLYNKSTFTQDKIDVFFKSKKVKS